MKNFKFSDSHYARLVSGPVNLTCFISIKRPESKVCDRYVIHILDLKDHIIVPYIAQPHQKRPLPPVVYL